MRRELYIDMCQTIFLCAVDTFFLSAEHLYITHWYVLFLSNIIFYVVSYKKERGYYFELIQVYQNLVYSVYNVFLTLAIDSIYIHRVRVKYFCMLVYKKRVQNMSTVIIPDDGQKINKKELSYMGYYLQHFKKYCL